MTCDRQVQPLPIRIRPCAEPDMAAVREIYAHSVLNEAASFELEPPSLEEMRRRRGDILARGFPYLVADAGGEIVGYAYAAPYRLRPAYRWTAENSVYVRPGHARRRIGRRLMQALLAECEVKGLRQIVAVIGDSANAGSIGLHRSLGFTTIGTIRAAGWKFDRWVDSVLMQRSLGPGDSAPP